MKKVCIPKRVWKTIEVGFFENIRPNKFSYKFFDSFASCVIVKFFDLFIIFKLPPLYLFLYNIYYHT